MISIVWLRRDLRLRDNAALFHAGRESDRVCVAFVLNPPLLRTPSIGSPLVAAFFDALAALRADLRDRGSDLVLLTGDFAHELVVLAERIGAHTVHFNVDYEPSALQRDADVESALQARGIAARAHLDHVYFSADEIVQNDGRPYRVFTPYKRRWLDARSLGPRRPFPSLRASAQHLIPRDELPPSSDIPHPEDFGFSSAAPRRRISEVSAHKRLRAFLAGPVEDYASARNFAAVDGTSQLSPDLRAGTIGIRTCVESAFECAGSASAAVRENIMTWVSELIWRDFYQMILKRFPHVAAGPFLAAGQNMPWRDAPGDFAAWCDGRTGYPIVDAAMRGLNTTGWMHNRLRMIVASFLTKHLLIDWRRGERYFEQHLADADLAQNNGGWQWAASTGNDAAPYFRIFNPTAQGKQFDPDGVFVRRMIPELADVPGGFIHEPWLAPAANYPLPIVEHKAARERALCTYRLAFSKHREE